jgi:hypothetical protein
VKTPEAFMKLTFVFILFLSFSAYAQELPKLKKLNGHKVIFQSKNVREVKSRGLFKTRVVASWGVHVFEVADAYFKCSTSRCSYDSAKSRHFFEYCALKQGQMRCAKRLTPETGSAPEHRGYWERNADGEYVRREDAAEEEYPSRSEESWESDGVALF